MKPSPRYSAVRKAQHVLRLGPPPWVCYRCGETRPHLLQLHHYQGKQRDPKRTVLICSNCHLDEEEKLAGRKLRGKREHSKQARGLARLECLEILFKDLPDVLAEIRRDLEVSK